MTTVYFDITDIIQFARRSNRLTGIQRVEFNLVHLLSRKYGGGLVRCIFFHPGRGGYVECDPAEFDTGSEFDAEQVLYLLGLAKPSVRYPSTVRIKSFLRGRARNKWHRAWLKTSIYVAAWLAPGRLKAWGLTPSGNRQGVKPFVQLRPVERLAEDSRLVHLGSTWHVPQTWQFAARHKAQGGDVVQYIHDLIPVTHPQFMPDKEPSEFVHWLEKALQYATRLPCNSRWTAGDLQRFADARHVQAKLGIVPLAHEFIGFARNSDPPLPQRLSALANKRFVLNVGTIEARKNGLSLLKVWRELHAQLGAATPLLVFAGRFGRIGGEEVRRYIESHPELSSLVHVVDGPSDQAMAWLYRNCLFSTYPSFVEGWGLPVGESAWFGRYCVASSASSIPEVCGSLAGYVDPCDLDNIKAELLKPLLDPSYLQQREAALAAAQLRTWQAVADDLYDYLTRPVGNSSNHSYV